MGIKRKISAPITWDSARGPIDIKEMNDEHIFCALGVLEQRILHLESVRNKFDDYRIVAITGTNDDLARIIDTKLVDWSTLQIHMLEELQRRGI